jgi:putative transposase
MSTAFHPQTDGQTERMHRTLAQILRALLFQDQPELWAEKLPYVELAINSATNATT